MKRGPMATAAVADAQREGGRGGRGRGGFGRGGGFGLTTVQLATVEEVQAALNLSDEQKDKVDQINDDLRQARRDLRDQGGDFREMMGEMQKLNDEATAKLTEALDETQNKRLNGILAQLDVSAALNNASIAKELAITDEQKEQLAEVRDGNREAMGEAMRDLRDQNLSREEFGAKMNELRDEAGKKLLAALTAEQQAQFEALKGEPVKIDMSQFGFGGRGGRGGDRGRDRDRGDRGGEAAEGGAVDRGA